jgi:plastocyanin
MTAISQQPARRLHVGRPSAKAVLATVAGVAVLWGALSIQGAVLGDRQSSSEAQLQDQIHRLETNLATTQDQLKAAQAQAKAAPAQQSAARPAPAAASAGSAAISAGPVSLKATDNKFSITQLTVAAGKPATLTFTNSGSAMHNFHIVGLPGADGKDVQTDLLGPGKSQTLSFTPSKPGSYKFRCDVHPTEMTGTLVVQ